MSSVYEQRTRVGDREILARYLPSAVANYLFDPNDGAEPSFDLNAHIARLQELLQIVVSYVPDHVGLVQAAHPVLRIGHISRTASTLLSADLSGFTAFSARLSTLGGEGAELVARTINELFSALFGVLDSWGGSLLKLSGDALTVLFEGPDHERRAVAAALALQARMDDFQALATPAGVFTLRMRIGAACGDVLMAEVGTPDRIELLVAGAAARRAVEIQRQALPGTVVVDRNVYRALEPVCQALTVAAGRYRILASMAPPQAEPPVALKWVLRSDPVWELHGLVARLEALRPYLVDQYLVRLATGAPALAGEGDLRPVTVLFAHLVDSGPQLERAEPDTKDQRRTTSDEEPVIRPGEKQSTERGLSRGEGNRQQVTDNIQTSVQRIWEIVARYGGTINKLDLHPDGHTLMVLFGAPIAQGRDAERAASCALALLREVGAASAAEPLAVRRIGIATGRVFAGAVGSPERREYTVMGSVVNLAARLMDLASEGQILVGTATAAAIWRFELLALPPVLIKGYDEPIPFSEVIAEQPGGLGELLGKLGPLFGRQDDLAAARAAVAGALVGRGSVVELIGEAGIGKSHLLAEVVRSVLAEGRRDRPRPVIVFVQAHVHSRGRPYAVVADILRRLYDLPEQPEQAAEAVAAYIYEHTPAHKRFLPLLQAMLGFHGAENQLTQALTPDERRARLHDLVVALIASHARAQAIALVLEDLHWADPASLQFLGDLAVASITLPIVLLCTSRPDEMPRWPAEVAITRVALQGLPDDQSQALLHERLGALALPDEICASVLERTQGNPFFIEETARVLRERSIDARDTPPVPATVQGALLARLDRLRAEERYLLQVAAVIGSRVPTSLLITLVRGQMVVSETLERLAARGLLRPDGTIDNYVFVHSLTQETAYESLLFAQRRELHRRVADLLRESDPQRADEEPGLLAFHYGRAEAWEESLEFARRAGVRAQLLYAGDLALNHYRQALEAADRLGAVAASRRPEILRCCGDIHALGGRSAAAVAAFKAALAASDDAHERAEILLGWAEACEQQAAYAEALALLDQAATALADQADEPLALRVQVRRGWVLTRQGAVEEARAAVEPCLERLEEQERWHDLLLAYKIFFQIALDECQWSAARAYLRLAFSYAERIGDLREIARIHNNMSVVLVQESDLRQAAQSCQHAIRVIEEIGDRYNLALFKGNAGVIYYKLGDFATALDCYNDSLRIAIAIGNQSIESTARSNLGEIERRLGRLAESLSQLQRSIELCREIGDDLGLSEAYRQLAETYLATEQLDEAADACDQAYAFAAAAGDIQAEAIAHRVRGMLAAARGDYDTALAILADSVCMLTELGSAHELGQSLFVQASVLISAGQSEAARAFLAEAIEVLRRAGAAADLAQVELLWTATQTGAAVEEIHP